MTTATEHPMTDPADVVRLATASGTTIAVAESLTAGMVCARIADVPGASAVLRGGVVAYAADLKTSLLDVDRELLAARGPVDPDVALAMALGVRDRLGADVGIATTGVAGPDPQDGVAPGSVYVAVTAPVESSGVPRPGVIKVPRPGVIKHVVTPTGAVWELAFEGDRAAVRAGATDAALALLRDVLARV